MLSFLYSPTLTSIHDYWKTIPLTRRTFVGKIMSLLLLLICCLGRTSLLAQPIKHLPTMQETWVQSLGWEDPLEKEVASHSNTFAWKIPWTEEPGGQISSMPWIFIKKPTHEPLRMPDLFKFLSESCSVMSDSLPPHGLNSPGKNTGVGSHFFLQGIFPTQGSNPGLPHCRWILYQLRHQGSLRKPTHELLGMPDLGVPKTGPQVPPIFHICH